VFDQFILQKPDLKPAPGLLTEWGWNDDRTKVWMTVREGVTWHDGSPFTAEDVAWSLARAADPGDRQPDPVRLVDADQLQGRGQQGHRRRGSSSTRPIFKWMYFLTGYVLPKAYYEKVGAEGFEAAPIGTGPYMVEKFERNAFVRLKANPNYWGGKPAFETVTIKFVTDAASPRGRSRIRQLPRHAGNALRGIRPPEGQGRLPASRADLRHRHDLPQRHRRDARPNVRKAAAHAIDKQTAHRPPAVGLRRADRHAGDAGIRGLRPVDHGRLRPRTGVEAAGRLRLLDRQSGEVQDPDHRASSPRTTR
jgi:peptide/nickel transport system substrate-binding protein